MRILLTNDDGYGAPGLEVLLHYLMAAPEPAGGAHEIVVIAPEVERSGVSHAMSLRNPLKIREVDKGRYTCSGTPADCVIVAGLKVMEKGVDVVISGINRGPNLGTDIIYSGTCGAARQAALVGIPAIAISCARYVEPLDYRAGAAFVASHLEKLVSTWKPDSFVNINAPSSDDESLPARWAVPGRNHYHDTMRSFEGAAGYTYCYLAEGRSERAFNPDSDHHAVQDGFIALSLVNIHPEAAHPAEWNGSTFP